MSIIINELEVVVAAAPESGAAAQGARNTAAAPPASPTSPMDIAALLERRERQARRVFAH